jgi:cation diffusion facilitator family transporter
MTAPNRSLERWGWASIGVNVVLSGINLAAMLASGSVAVAAEMVHNLVDLVASVAVLVGLRLAARRSPRFPYGLYKIENLVAAFVALLIFAAAYEIGRTALLGSTTELVVTPWVLLAVGVSVVLPAAFSVLEHRAGRAAGSPSLMADAKEFRVHVLTSGLVLLSLLAHALPIPVDRIAAVLVAVIIGHTGWQLLADAMRVLLDASLDKETLERARQLLEREPSVRRVLALHGRNAGRVRFLEADLELRHRDQQRAAKTVRHLEQQLREAIERVERVHLAVLPHSSDRIRIACPLKSTDGEISAHFGTAPWFLLEDRSREDGAVVGRRYLQNAHATGPKGRGLKVAHWLSDQRIDVLVTRDDLTDRGPGYALGDAGVEIILTEGTDVEQAMTQAHAQLQR